MPPKATSGNKVVSRDLVTLVLASLIKKQGSAIVDNKFMSAISTLWGEDRARTESSIEHELRTLKQDANELIKKADQLEKAGKAVEPPPPRARGYTIPKVVPGAQSNKRKRIIAADGEDDYERPPSHPKSQKQQPNIKTEDYEEDLAL